MRFPGIGLGLAGSVVTDGINAGHGFEWLTEEEYFALQKLGEFDTRTSNWIATPADIPERGGALYGEAPYGRIFIGHNGAQSYYAVRGFRGVFRV